MSDQTDPRSVIARAILTNGALKISPEKPFRWASGYQMPVYIDNRCLIGYPEVRMAIAEAFAARIHESGIKYDAIAGIATGAIPHATTLADKLALPLLYVRPKPKDHGTGRMVEGDIPGGIAGKNVLVIEDTISTGGSAVNAVEAVRKEGANARALMAIYYHDLPGSQSPFETMTPPCAFFPLITFADILKTIKDDGVFDEKTIAELEAWHKDPFTWGESRGFPRITE